MRKAASLCVVLALSAALAFAQSAATKNAALAPLDGLMPELEKLYLDLHQSPELSQHEEKTSAKMAERLRALGYQVTDGFGGYGVVGILENGKGPTVMIRTDLDALPVEEKTGALYASKVRTKDDAGSDVGVMHACGHDTHMASWVGTATLLAKSKDRWRGTVMMVGQPDEEKDSGARAMLKAGLFTKFKKPDFAIAMHDNADMPAGVVGLAAGYVLANVDSVDMTIIGRGGHGAYPYKTVDPIVIAARTILALQTIASRENNPLDPVVITVGSIHGGTKHNIIPDEVKLQLTVRSYKDDVRKKLIESITRIAKAEAAAAGAPKEPRITVLTGDSSTYNDPALAKRLADVLRRAYGADRVTEPSPVMASEDFSEYGRAGVPAVILWVGGVNPAKYDAAKASGAPLPSLHSSQWLPDYSPTVRMGVSSLTLAALELLGKP